MPTLAPLVRRFLTSAFPDATPEQIDIVGRSLLAALDDATAPTAEAHAKASLERLAAASRAFHDALRDVENDGDAHRGLGMSGSTLRLLRWVSSRSTIARARAERWADPRPRELSNARLAAFLVSARDAWSAIAPRDERDRLRQRFGQEGSIDFVRDALALAAVVLTPETIRDAIALLPRERGGILKRQPRRPTVRRPGIHGASPR